MPTSDNQELRACFLHALYFMGINESREFDGQGRPPCIVRKHSENSFEFIDGAPRFKHGGYYCRFRMAELLASTPFVP